MTVRSPAQTRRRLRRAASVRSNGFADRAFALQKRIPVSCPGVDHGDFSTHASYMILSCEFSARLVKIDLRAETVAGYLDLHGSSPQDVKLSPDGTIFYVADMYLGGVHLIDAATFTQVGFITTGRDAHGLYPSRNGQLL